jgi:Uma2 family endonuclease
MIIDGMPKFRKKPEAEGGTIMALHEYPYIDIEDYLALDNTVKSARYEYIDGTLRMQAGGSPDHAIITSNLNAILNYALRKKPCIVYSPDVRVQLSESRYFHPDVTVGCDPRDVGEKNAIRYPRLLVEVLSPSTEAIDKGEKLDIYLDYPGVEEYMLVSSQKKVIEVYYHDGDTWASRLYKISSTIHLKSIDVLVPFNDVYEKTSLA